MVERSKTKDTKVDRKQEKETKKTDDNLTHGKFTKQIEVITE